MSLGRWFLVGVFAPADGAAVSGFAGLIGFARVLDSVSLAMIGILRFVVADALRDTRRFRSMVRVIHFCFRFSFYVSFVVAVSKLSGFVYFSY